MRIMKFEGATMRDAVAKVKAELGDHAVIISSRQVRKGLLGSAVEISAAIDDDGDDKQIEPAPAPAFTRGNPYANPNTNPNPAKDNDADIEKAMAPLRSELRSLRAMVRSNNNPPAAPAQDTKKLEAEIAALRQLVEKLSTAAQMPAKKVSKIEAAIEMAEPASPANVGRAASPEAMRSELASPTNVVRAASPEAMRSQIEKASAESIADAVAGLAHKRSRTVNAEAPLVAPSTARVVMLVGPTGAGKTTTIAKLAAHAALVEGRRVRLITLDTFRIGGVDQIRTFADLIGVPLTVLDNAADLAIAIEESQDENGDDAELILIDTAGRSPRDTAHVIELATAISSLRDLEVHLAIPASASASAIDELVTHYTPLSPSRLLFTKVDEQSCVPELLEAPRRTHLPITWVTTGQQVPEDLEQPTAKRLGHLAAHSISSTSRTRAA